MKEIPIIEPRQKFDVIVVDGENNAHRFNDGGFSISAGGVLSVTTADGKHAKAWANGFWISCEVVTADG